MSQSHVPFPSIEQFRTVVKKVRDRAKFHGVPLPKLTFHGTVKLHGTNAAVVENVDERGVLWAQSRSNVITVESDNAGFARFVSEKLPNFQTLIGAAKASGAVAGGFAMPSGSRIAVYGEWCGQGIQKGVAITQLPKMFVVFAIRVKPPIEDGIDGDVSSYWLTPAEIYAVMAAYFSLYPRSDAIRSVAEFPTWTMEIDFANPEMVQNALGEITQEVEKECPVGKALGVSGVGEGVVWRAVSAPPVEGFRVSDLVFKVKGEKHSETKVRTLAAVDVERLASIQLFVGSVLTNHRLEKMIDKLREQNLEADIKSTGAFLKLVGSDVLAEEGDTIEASGFERKDVMPAVNAAARQWYMSNLSS
jgi:hypothetical protein